MQEYGFRPQKRLGQDFLIDRNILDKILRFSQIGPEDTVLEIGAGLGNITQEIADRARRVIAVEYDRRLFSLLQDRLTRAGYRNIEFICQDILELDLGRIAAGSKIKIIGNVPYYITTPIIELIIESRAFVRDAVLMVQKEVGERMLAASGSKTYSPLSCYIQFHTKPAFKSVVKRTSFYPRPEVDSALIRLDIPELPSVSVDDEKLFFRIVRGSFNQRRKMLLSSLDHLGFAGLDKEAIKELLRSCGVDWARRPESVNLEEFARIANAFARR